MTPQPDHMPRQDAQSAVEAGAIPAFLGGGNEHPLIDIPFSVYVDGRQYAGQGISLLEAHVVGLADPALENQERLVRIAFDFGGFSVSLHPTVRILRDGPQRLVLRFTQPTGDHLPQLRHILNDYISGDLTSLGTIIRANPVGQPKAGGTRSARAGVWSIVRRLLGTAVVLGLALLLLALAAMLIGQRLLVTRLASPGQLVIAGETLRAVADGQITYLDLEAPEGEVAFSIASISGETLSYAMPCDCEALSAGVAEGSTVLAGEPILTLVEGIPSTVVDASIPVAALFDLQQAGGAEMQLADGRAVFGELTEHSPVTTAEDELVQVRLAPVQPIEVELAGQAVELRIRREPESLVTRLQEAWTSASSLWTTPSQS